jgi:dihydrodipicolinate synthase/N-acetylneuraminate lyase
VGKLSEVVAAVPTDFNVIVGSSSTFYASLCVGARGGILALACVLPEACARLYKLVQRQQHREALALQQHIATLARLVGSLYGVPGLKAALALIGLDFGPPRRPLRPLDAGARSTIQHALEQIEEPVV